MKKKSLFCQVLIVDKNAKKCAPKKAKKEK